MIDARRREVFTLAGGVPVVLLDLVAELGGRSAGLVTALVAATPLDVASRSLSSITQSQTRSAFS